MGLLRAAGWILAAVIGLAVGLGLRFFMVIPVLLGLIGMQVGGIEGGVAVALALLLATLWWGFLADVMVGWFGGYTVHPYRAQKARSRVTRRWRGFGRLLRRQRQERR